MRGAVLIAIGLSLGGCAHRVELYCDENTPCTDPARSFCDLAGTFPASEGVRNTCIPTPESEIDAGPPEEPNTVFVTSTQHTGALGGLEGADAICNERSAAAGLSGRYLAWLSTSAVDARERLAGARGWVRTDGLPFADSVEDLLAGRIFYPASRDENQNRLGGYVMTGTRADGRFDSANGDCGGFSQESGSVLVGHSEGGHQLFTAHVPFGCQSDFALLCFGVDRIARVQPARDTGRIAFVTRGRLRGTAGAAAFDAMCAQEASEAGHAGTFLAAIATTTTAIRDRMDTDGPPWVRADGIRLVNSAGEINTDVNALLAPIQYPVDGETPVDEDVWTGAMGFDGVNPNCGDWADGTEGGTVGRSSAAGREAVAHNGSSCGELRPVYCFEQ